MLHGYVETILEDGFLSEYRSIFYDLNIQEDSRVLTGTSSFLTSSTARCSLTLALFSVSSTVIKTWSSSLRCSQFGFPLFSSSWHHNHITDKSTSLQYRENTILTIIGLAKIKAFKSKFFSYFNNIIAYTHFTKHNYDTKYVMFCYILKCLFLNPDQRYF